MAFTSQQIVDYLLANPGMTDAQIVAAMETFQISPAQMAAAVNLPVGEVVSRVAPTVPINQGILLGDTWIMPNYSYKSFISHIKKMAYADDSNFFDCFIPLVFNLDK